MKTDNLLICGIIISANIFINCISYANSSVILPVKKVILDVDTGGDDAAAILISLGAEKFGEGPKVVAITCVNGNADVNRVALNVLKTLKAANRLNIPVYKGASCPLLMPDKKDHYFGQDGFGDFYYPDPPSINLIQEEHAVNAMIRLVRNNPGEITIVALGPLTNIALAIRLYPQFLNKVQQLIITGGSINGVGNVKPGIEYNFYVDPVATFAVFNTSTPRLKTLIPFDTAQKIIVSKGFKTAVRRLNNAKTWLIDSANAAHIEFEKDSPAPTDMVTAIVALTSGSIVTKSAIFNANIIHCGIDTAGMIVVDYSNRTSKAPNVNIIQDINVKEFERLSLRYYS